MVASDLGFFRNWLASSKYRIREDGKDCNKYCINFFFWGWGWGFIGIRVFLFLRGLGYFFERGKVSVRKSFVLLFVYYVCSLILCSI